MSMDTGQATDRLTRILDDLEGGGADSASETPSEQPTEEKPPAGGEAPSAGALGVLFGRLTADPQLLSTLLPALLSALPNGSGGQGTPPAASAPTGTLSEGSTPRRVSLDRHTALLCAVKPYLGERRQATAETVLRLCRLWDALGRAGVTPSMLAGLLGGGSSERTPPSDTETGG